MLTPRELVGRGVTAAIDAARAVRPATRGGERHFRDGLRFRHDAQDWSDDARRAWTLRRLREVVREAARTTPFYRERLQHIGFDAGRDFDFDDFARLPVLERADVHRDVDRMLSPEVAPQGRRRDGTGGSTGVPLVYYSGPRERGWRLSGQEHFMRRLGVPRGVSTAFLWGHHLDARERTEWRERVRDALTNRRWYDCFRLEPEVLLAYHEEMARTRPACLVAYASALDSLASVLLERGMAADYPQHRIVTGAEKLWPQQRARIERAFPVPVHERYGSREVGLIGMQVATGESPAFEVDWANLLVEPDRDGGEADILVTKLNADAMPMLRYRIGDVGRFPSGSRPGHPALQLTEVHGRILDRLHLPNGRWLHGVGIAHLMKDFPLREFQIRQAADYSIEVVLVPNTGYEPSHGDAILAVLQLNLPGLPMHLTIANEIPRSGANKWRPVLSHVAAAAHPTPSSPVP